MARKIRERLENLRHEVIEQIISIVNSVGGELYIVDVYGGDSPIVQEDFFDENNTYTLDKITVEEGELYLDGSSSYANYTWRGDNLDIIRLVSVLDYLEEHEENIKELKED